MRFGAATSEQIEVATMERPHQLRLIGEDRGMRYERDHMVDAVFGAGSHLVLVFRTRASTPTGCAVADFRRTFTDINLLDLADLAAAIGARASDRPRPA
jgi:hypothetical protein